MSKRLNDPRRLDVARFADAAGELVGAWPPEMMARLAGSVYRQPANAAPAPIEWQVRGERRKTKAAEGQIWLHLRADADLSLECQRCLQPVSTRVEARRSFLFVAGEEVAAALDEECDDDVLSLTRALDVLELVEDELLLALPLVPKHDVCPQPLMVERGDSPQPDVSHPFAGLAALKAKTRNE